MRAAMGAAAEVRGAPAGGGATRSIGDTFEPDLHTGAGGYAIGLWFPDGPGRLRPELSLSYSSGVGNGPFGVGWRLQTVQVTRRTDVGVPTYGLDDRLLLDGAELVEVSPGVYRARLESSFMLVERQGDGWRLRDRLGRSYLVGTQPAARVADPADPRRVAEWHIESVSTTHGQAIRYSHVSTAERLVVSTIEYGPYRVAFHYEPRTDVLVDRRYGFPLTTAGRCSAITYHLDGSPDPFRRLDLAYEDCPHTGTSMLASVTSVGIAEDGSQVALPPVRLGYSRFVPERRLVPMRSAVGHPPPRPVSDATFDLVDLDGDGLPGVLELSSTARRYWPNLGDGSWGPPRTLRDVPLPATLDRAGVAVADADGDASVDLLVLDERPVGYYRGAAGGFAEHVVVQDGPAVDLRDRRLRLVDLDGNGIADLLRSTGDAWYAVINRGPQGWERPRQVSTRHVDGPEIDLADPRVRLADLSGDGLFDLVRVHAGVLEIWPSLGRGRFGTVQRWAFDVDRGEWFVATRIHLADVTGTGSADIVLVGTDRVVLWCNRGGGFAPPVTIARTPRAAHDAVAVLDLLGEGGGGVLYTQPWSRTDPENYKFLPLYRDAHPHLLTSIDDGVGLVTEIAYSSAAKQARAAARDGEPWATSLPFHVPVVERITRRDVVRGTDEVTTIAYRDGWFDREHREFGGFREVAATEHGDGDIGDLVSVSTFHQGRPGEVADVPRERLRALRGRLRSLEVFAGEAGDPSRRETSVYAVDRLAQGPGGAVDFAHLVATEVTEQHGGVTEVTSTALRYDPHGNIVGKTERWQTPGGERRIDTVMRFIADPDRWILALPVERVERTEAGSVLAWERFRYDGPAFEGLPLGQVTHGLVTSHERLVLTDDLVAGTYGGDLGDPTALGLHRMEDPQVAAGWGAFTVAYRRDPDGTPNATRDARGSTTELTLDADRTHVSRTRNALGHERLITTDRRTGEIAALVEPNGQATTYVHDAIGRLVAMVKPGDTLAHPTIRIRRHEDTLPFGRRVEIRRDPGETVTTQQVEYMDGHGAVFQRREQVDGTRVVVDAFRRYDARGFEVERTTPFFSTGLDFVRDEGSELAARYRFRRDRAGRVVECVTPDGLVSRTEHGLRTVSRTDVAGRRRDEILDPRGGIGEVRERADASTTLVTTIERDHRGNVASVVDARGVALATYVHDHLARPIEVQHADAGRRRVVLDAAGDVRRTIDAAGRVVDRDVDALGRATLIAVDGVPAERFVYDTGPGSDLLGRLAKVEDAAGTLVLDYDARGRPTRRTRTFALEGQTRTLEVASEYDAADRIREVTYPDGTSVTYDYDGRGRLARVTGVIDGIERDALGRAVRTRYVNGIVERHHFDPATFYETAVTVTAPDGSALLDLSYGHDAVGNVLAVDDRALATRPGAQLQFDYDARGQIGRAAGTVGTDPLDVGYEFDDAGNPLAFDEHGSRTLAVEAGSNRLATVTDGAGSPIAFAHDANGNLTSSPGRATTFDARGRLIRIDLDDGRVVEVVYDYRGQRAIRRVTDAQGTTETLFLDDVYEETEGVAANHVVHDGVRVATRAATDVRVYHLDATRNAVLVTDHAGAVTWQAGYLPFGALAFTSGGPDGAGFMGLPADGVTGLVWTGVRVYDPALGRFLSPDLAVVLDPDPFVTLPLHLNPYLYAGNNPLRTADPDGLWWQYVVGGLIIAALVVATIVVGVATGGAGFAFGILLAASIGSALGAGIGAASAATGGGDPADGFLFGAVVGGVGGAAGYAVGAAVAAAGISGVWGSILAGAAQGAVAGAANGAIVGYAGGAGSWEQVLTGAAIGMAIGAVVGGAVGALTHSPPDVSGAAEKGIMSSNVKGQSGEAFWRGVAGQAGKLEAPAQAAINAVATPIGTNVLINVGVAGGVTLVHYWDELRLWVLDLTGEDEVTVPLPSGSFA
ncbi:MAG TPA: toxin TcdB middle/N-terminal domain-containing protein [Nitriliruptorales bacterium]